jgi:hypothetical protein
VARVPLGLLQSGDASSPFACSKNDFKQRPECEGRRGDEQNFFEVGHRRTKARSTNAAISSRLKPSPRPLPAIRTLSPQNLTGKQLAKAAGIDASTLSRLETSGIRAVSGRVYEAVLDALKHAGVEIEGNMLRLTKKPRR